VLDCAFSHFTKEQAGEVVVKAGGTLLAPKAAEAIVETFATGDALRPVAEPVLLSIFLAVNESRWMMVATRLLRNRLKPLVVVSLRASTTLPSRRFGPPAPKIPARRPIQPSGL
jgi:hypothetical protein